MTGTVALFRTALLAILAVGIGGTLAELLLLEHFDGWEQWIPLALFIVALVAISWHLLGRGAASVRFIRLLMGIFVISGVVGIYLHYRGNVEFELEMEPALTGWALIKASMMGATPALAPGTMVQLGLIGLLWSWKHPALSVERSTSTMET